MASNGITARLNFHRIWIAGKKSLVKRAPGNTFIKGQSLGPKNVIDKHNIFLSEIVYSPCVPVGKKWCVIWKILRAVDWIMIKYLTLKGARPYACVPLFHLVMDL